MENTASTISIEEQGSASNITAEVFLAIASACNPWRQIHQVLIGPHEPSFVRYFRLDSTCCEPCKIFHHMMTSILEDQDRIQNTSIEWNVSWSQSDKLEVRTDNLGDFSRQFKIFRSRGKLKLVFACSIPRKIVNLC